MDLNTRIERFSAPEKVDMADDWYQFATQDHFWIKARFRAIKSRITKEQIGTHLFEIGCGHGMIIQQFEEDLNVVVDGCDLNLPALSQIQNTKGRIFCLDIFDQPKELFRKYDSVLLMDVIEHISDDVNFLKQSAEYVKPGGMVIINVPALNSLFSKYDVAAGHKRRYDKKMMKALFTKCGIEQVSIFYWGLSMIPIALIRKILLNFVGEKEIISTGFSTSSKTMNNLLNWLLTWENKLIANPFLGTSLVAIGKVK